MFICALALVGSVTYGKNVVESIAIRETFEDVQNEQSGGRGKRPY